MPETINKQRVVLKSTDDPHLCQAFQEVCDPHAKEETWLEAFDLLHERDALHVDVSDETGKRLPPAKPSSDGADKTRNQWLAVPTVLYVFAALMTFHAVHVMALGAGQYANFRGDYQTAAALLRIATLTNPLDVRGFCSASGNYSDLGLYGKAEEQAIRACVLAPTDPAGYIQRSRAVSGLNATDSAIGFAQKAVNLNSSRPSGWVALGEAQLGAGNYGAAADALSEAIDKGSSSGDVYANRAVAEHWLGNDGNAIEDYSVAIARSPKSAQLLAARGECYLDRDSNLAARDFEGAIRNYKDDSEDPNDPHRPTLARWNADAADAYNRAGQFEAAITCASKAVAMNPAYGSALYQLAYGEQHMQLFELAAPDYSRAILGGLLQTGDALLGRAACYGHLQQFVKMDEDLSEAHFTYGVEIAQTEEVRREVRDLFPQQRDAIDYGPFMANLQREIKSNWFPQQKPGNWQSKVSFCVKDDGTTSNLRLIESSGDEAQDKLALAAIPAQMLGLPIGSPEKRDIHFTFEWKTRNGDGPTLYGQPIGDAFSSSGSVKVPHWRRGRVSP